MSRDHCTLTLQGHVSAGEPACPLSHLFVRVLTNDARHPAAVGMSDTLGRFRIELPLGPSLKLRSSTRLSFALSRQPKGPTFHTSAPLRLAALSHGGVVVHVPPADLARGFRQPSVQLLVDESEADTVAIGQTLALQGTGLLPNRAYTLSWQAGEASGSARKAPRLQHTLTTDAAGRLERTVVLPQFGLSALGSSETLSASAALRQLGGQTLSWTLGEGRRTVAKGALRIDKRLRTPLAFVANEHGELLNAIQGDRDELSVALVNMPPGPLRAWLVNRRDGWSTGDPVEPLRDRQGRPLVFDELTPSEQSTVVRLAAPGRIPPGAYAMVLRPMRYGFEADEQWHLQPRDIVLGRGFTGLVVREEFWTAKPVLGGCVNAFPMSGSPVSGAPYFRYRDTFAVGENIYAAMDPGIVMPGQMGKKIAFNVVASKTAAQWNASNALTHVPPVGPLQVVLQGGCINANKQLVWPSAPQVGSFDIVADFGNNDPNPASFVPDGQFNTPVDMIDGYFTPGFRVVRDPGTMSDWPDVGAFSIDAALLSGLGIGATMTVQDENSAYFTPGSFVPVNVNIPRLAIVRFPADAPGATQPSQISAAQADYPLFVVVHGNGHTYTHYAFLLEHMARNGFIAVSIHLNGGLAGLARANAFFDHMSTLSTLFGTSLRNQVAVLGHSRGGEAVFKIARLNQSLGLGIGLQALLALGPTDQYGREVLSGAAAKPLFVLYGAKDDDVSGWTPYAGYNVRQSGFSLYDRASGSEKAMAYVADATHNGFVTHNEAFGAAPVPPLMSVADQQKILLAYTLAFCRMHILGETEWVGMFTGEWKPPAVGATGAVMAFQYRHTQRRAVDEFEGPHAAGDWQASTLGGTVAETGLPASPVETQLYPQDNQSPHDTGGLRLRWDSAGDQLAFDLPVGQRDVTPFSHLSVRMGKVVGSASNPAGPQNLRIGLRDGSGNERLIRASAFGGIPEIAVANEPANTKSSLSTLRIPLSAYTVVCAGAVQVDLTNITQVKLAFTEMPSGEIAVDELEFTL